MIRTSGCPAPTVETLTEVSDDRAVVFARGFRLTGRLHRRKPELSKVLLQHGLQLISAEAGPRAFGETLPRPLLLSAARRQVSVDQIANEYDVTIEMSRFPRLAPDTPAVEGTGARRPFGIPCRSLGAAAGVGLTQASDTPPNPPQQARPRQC